MEEKARGHPRLQKLFNFCGAAGDIDDTIMAL